MKDFLELFWEKLNKKGLYDEPSSKLNGLYIGNSRRELDGVYNFHGKYIGFHWEYYPIRL